QRRRAVAFLEVKEAAVQHGRGESGGQLQRPVVVPQGRAGLAPRGVSQTPVVEALRAAGRQGHADAEGADRLLVPPEARGTHPLVVVRPEALRLKADRLLEARGGGLQVAAAEEDAAEGVVFPGRGRRRLRGLPGDVRGSNGSPQRGRVELTL